MRLYYCLVLACLAAHALALDTNFIDPSILNSKQLIEAVYTPLGDGGDACIRLLNAQGVAGCAAPNQNIVSGPMITATALTPASDVPQGSVALVSAVDAGEFLRRCVAEETLRSKFTGVLIQHDGTFPGWNPASQSPLEEYPISSSSPDNNSDDNNDKREHIWNPKGKGLLQAPFPFPIFQLDNVSSPIAQQRALYNSENNSGGATNMARMELSMEASSNTTQCITDQTCLPLGGNSILAIVPPLPPPSPSTSDAASDSDATTNPPSPAILVVAGIDSSGLFHNLIKAADSPLSGLIAMLAAAEVLGGRQEAEEFYKRRIIFAAMMGDPWGLMGTRRLLWEMSNGTSKAVQGLSLESLEGLIEFGQIGKSVIGGSNTASQLYTHTDGTSAATQAAAPLIAALNAAANQGPAGNVSVKISPADSSSSQGLPPSSSRGFLLVRPDLPTVVLTEYNNEFLDEAYQTQYDTEDTINARSISATAMVLARALHEMAIIGGDINNNNTAQGDLSSSVPVLDINATQVQVRVNELMDCLVRDVPGMGCALVNRIMTPGNSGPAPHYVGILRTVTEDAQTPDATVQSDVERFIFNFLAIATAGNITDTETGSALLPPRCIPSNATIACPAGTVCTGYRDISGIEGTGVCANATVRYVPSYSTALECDGCNGTATYYDYRWKVTDQAKEWEMQYNWPADPMWTESNWPNDTPDLVMYLQESPGVENAVLAAGLSVTAVSVVLAVAVRFAWDKRLKRD